MEIMERKLNDIGKEHNDYVMKIQMETNQCPVEDRSSIGMGKVTSLLRVSR